MSRWCGSTRPVRLHGRGSEPLFGSKRGREYFAALRQAQGGPERRRGAGTALRVLRTKLPSPFWPRTRKWCTNGRRLPQPGEKNGPPTPHGRKRPLRWDGTPSLSATPCERFTENLQFSRRGCTTKKWQRPGVPPIACQSVGLVCSARFDKQTVAPLDRRSATFLCHTPDDFVICCRGTGAEARAVRRRLMGRPTAMPDQPHRARPRLHSPTGQEIFKVRGLDSPIA
jgi:hypothetical protein